jgi:hypothetical protein
MTGSPATPIAVPLKTGSGLGALAHGSIGGAPHLTVRSRHPDRDDGTPVPSTGATPGSSRLTTGADPDDGTWFDE